MKQTSHTDPLGIGPSKSFEMNEAGADSPASFPKRRGYLTLLVGAFWLFSLAVCLSRLSVWVEMASHFVWQAILGGALLGMLCAWRRRWRACGLVALPWCYLLVLFQPWNLWSSSPSVEVDSRQRLTVMSWNVLCVNENLEELHSVIEQHPVDVLVLIEVRPNLFEQIPKLDEMYKQRLAFPSWGGNGIAVLTNRDDIHLTRIDFGGKIMPSIAAKVGDGDLQILGVHTWSPYPPQRAVGRDRQLDEIGQWISQQDRPVCIVGDLNITPWAPAFSKLLRTGLVDSRTSGFGNSASWPAWLGPLGIPIDHALSHGSCEIINRKLGPMVRGSDHRPVLIEVRY